MELPSFFANSEVDLCVYSKDLVEDTGSPEVIFSKTLPARLIRKTTTRYSKDGRLISLAGRVLIPGDIPELDENEVSGESTATIGGSTMYLHSIQKIRDLDNSVVYVKLEVL